MSLDVHRTDDDGIAVFSLKGEFAFEESPGVRSALFDALADREIREIVVDLQDVAFIDSTGIGTLAVAHRVGGDECVVRVVNPTSAVRRVLDVTGVLGILTKA